MKPAEFDEATLHAFRALREGKANAGQQKAALGFILWDLCRINHLSFDDGSERKTAFAEGSRWVGLQIAGMADSKAPLVTKEAKEKAKTPRPTRRTKQEAKND